MDTPSRARLERGRIELADGFLAAGTGNDPYAIGYYLGEDLPVHSHAARRFTVLDRSADLENDFGLAGFRVPTILSSPYARQNYVDHRVYDHTSTLRFIEWRFLGAPPEGPGGDSTWNLTLRDRHANNIAASLGATHPHPSRRASTRTRSWSPTSSGRCWSASTPPPATPPGSTWRNRVRRAVSRLRTRLW